MTGVMCPPIMYAPMSLMAMRGDRVGRGWMAVNPDAPAPSLRAVLWLAVLVVGVVWFLSLMQPSP